MTSRRHRPSSPDAPAGRDADGGSGRPDGSVDGSGRRRRIGDAARGVGRWALGLALLGAGTGHLTTLRQEFRAQVPPWLPLDPDFVVVASGVVELGLGAALILAPRRLRPWVGWVTGAFFVAIFPGNVSQYVTGTDAFGLDTDTARLVRLFFQPLLVLWALWATAAWRERRQLRG